MPSRRSSPRPTGETMRKRRVVHPESRPCRRTNHAPVRSPVGSRAGTRSRSNRTATRSAPPSRISSSSSAPSPDAGLSRLRRFVRFVCKQNSLNRQYELFAALPLFVHFISFSPNEFYIRASSRAIRRDLLGWFPCLPSWIEEGSDARKIRSREGDQSCGRLRVWLKMFFFSLSYLSYFFTRYFFTRYK